MRISSKSIQMQWLATITQQQSQVARLQQQVGTGRRVNSAIDDPVGAAQITRFEQGLARLETYSRNADAAERRLNLQEIALSEGSDILNRVRDLTVQAGGAAAVAPGSRQAIADEVSELLTGLVDTANSQDGEGRYLFAGNRVESKPFPTLGGLPVYAGDQGARFQRIGDDRLIQESNSGDEVFQLIRNGNGVFSVTASATNTGTMNQTTATVLDATAWVPGDYSIQFTAPDRYDIVTSGGTPIREDEPYVPGALISFNGAVVSFEGEPAAGDEFQVNASRNQSVFVTVQSLVDTLRLDVNDPAVRAQFQSRLNGVLQDIDQSLGNINGVRSDVGARLNVIDRQRSVNEEVSFQIETSLSQVRDLDFASAISELELRLTSLEAAQRSFAETRRNSLFNFL